MSVDRKALMSEALVQIRELRAKLERVERAHTEPIAIVGMGCRFPGSAHDPDSLWNLLMHGVEAVTEISRERLDITSCYDPNPGAAGKVYTHRAALLDRVDEFDPQVFGISPREAEGMDPQHRILLEVVWEALENAAQPIEELRFSKTGVFVGMSSDDYLQLGVNPATLDMLDPHLCLGTSRAVAPGRIAYLLGLQGPALQVDTACSSSLVAVHLACQSLRLRECDLAIAGGVHLILAPLGMICRSRLQALSPDGRCKTFDASANGYVQGEGCGVVVLRRLSEALERGDDIAAVILGSAVNHDGPSNGLTAPSELAQEKVLRQALENSRVTPQELGYVEAHGTGTPLGDPIELGALRSAIVGHRSSDRPLVVGSAKTNFGHLEAAAGVISLIKTALSIQRNAIPPHLHFREPNPHADFSGFVVPVEQMAWPPGRRVAGVSSFGISGTNAHLVLAEAPDSSAQPAKVRPMHVLTISAKHENALDELVERYLAHLRQSPDEGFADDCMTSQVGRTHHPHRIAVVAHDRGDALSLLERAVAREPSPRIRRGHIGRQGSRKLAFLFSGQSSQYPRMGIELYGAETAFREAFDACSEELSTYCDRSPREVLYEFSREEWSDEDMLYAQPVLFAFQYALGSMWRAWGVEPQAVLGHSGGEYAAACFAGVFSLPDAARLLATRNNLMNSLPRNGAMLALLSDEESVARAIAPYSDMVSISALNAPGNVVISGEATAIETLHAELERAGVRARRLAVSHGGHSPLMDPILDDFLREASKIQYREPSTPFVSSVTGSRVTAEVAKAEYWVAQMRGPVRFDAATQVLLNDGFDSFLEIGPKATLLNLVRAIAPSALAETGLWLSSLRDGACWESVLCSLAALHVAGHSVDWSSFQRGYARQRRSLPTYPFQRRRYWSSTVQQVTMSTTDQKADPNHPAMRGGQVSAGGFDIVVETVREILAEVLRTPVSEIGADTPLLELGVDSFTLVSVIHALAERYSVRLSVRQLFEELTTARAIAARIRRDAPPAMPRPPAATPEAGSQAVANHQASQAGCQGPQTVVGYQPPQVHQAVQAAPGYQAAQAIPGYQAAQAAPGYQAAQATPGHQAAHVHQAAQAVPGYQAVQAPPGYQAAQVHQAAQAMPGYQAAQAMPGYQAAQAIPGYQAAQAIPGYQAVQAAPGYQAVHAVPGHQAAHVRQAVHAAPAQQAAQAGSAPQTSWAPNSILDDVRGVVAAALRLPISDLPHDVPLLELGADSFTLVSVIHAIAEKYTVRFSVRQLFEELTTVAAIAAKLRETASPMLTAPVEPAPWSSMHAATPATSGPSMAMPAVSTPPMAMPGASAAVLDSRAAAHASNVAMSPAFGAGPGGGAPSGDLIAHLTQQLHSLSQQVAALQAPGNGHGHHAFAAPAQPLTAPAAPAVIAPSRPATPEPAAASQAPGTPPRHGGANDRVEPPTPRELTPEQLAYLRNFVSRYTQRTRRSKEQRASSYTLCRRSPEFGFRFETKELFYPIIGQGASGAKLWDIDGNDYVDLTMGFGTLLLGHSPQFLTQALTEQLHKGMLIGPEAEHAIEVSRLICQTTGHERVQFTTSGTEAVMTAMRLARAATGRPKVAMFRNSYHGHFDGTLVAAAPGEVQARPLVIGTPQSMVDDVLVLSFDDPGALDVILQHKDELAAVLVEPVQSRRPDIQARAFLLQLRELTARCGIVLIFDEIFHGYRIHLGGLQAWFNVKADLATYGKALANGMPVGVVAGNSWILDRVDGGRWQYGDNSYPLLRKTFVAGTFSKHPLVMRAAREVLHHIIAHSPALHEDLNRKTAGMAARLNEYFAAEELPLRIVHFGSNFRFAVNGNLSFIHQYQPLELDIFFYHLIHNGIYVWEGRTCFLSAAHTDEDVNRIVGAVQESVRQMRQGGFWLPPNNGPQHGSGSGSARHDTVAAPGSQSRSEAVGPAQPIPYLARSSAPIVNPESVLRSAPEPAGPARARTPEPVMMVYPTTSDQRMFWLLGRMSEEGSICYNQATTLDLLGELDVDALRRAVQRVVDRHSALRTTISDDGQSQRVHTFVKTEVPLLDLSNLDPATQERRITEFYDEEARRAFDMSGFLFRFQLIRLEPRRHLLASAVHFLVCDGVSLGIIFQDLQAFYSAEVQGLPLELPPPMQFSQAIRRRDELSNSAKLAAQEAYWLREIERPLPVLDLPTDRPRPPIKTFNGRRHTIRVDANTYALLRRFSQERRCTYFMTLMACFSALLHRLSGQPEVILGVAFSGRNLLEGSDAMVGFISNLLPIRCQLDEGMTFGSYLERLRGVLLQAYENQDYQLPKLLEKAKQPTDPSRLALFNVVFNWDRYTIPDMHGLDVRFFPQPIKTAPRDIMPTVFEVNGELIINWDYNTDLFDEETIRRMADQYQELLDGILVQPDARVEELSLVSEAERHRLLIEFNQTAMPVPDLQAIGELFSQQAARTPGRLALRCGDVELTFAQLEARTNQLAHWLRQRGVGPDVPVALHLDRSVEAMVSLLGILKAGGAVVPLPVDAPQARLRMMLDEIQAPVLIAHRSEGHASSGSVKEVLWVEDMSVLDREPTTRPAPTATIENLAYIMYTSGSTGHPKGAMITHASVVNLLAALEQVVYTDARDDLRVGMNGALSFDTSVKQWLQLLRGRTLVLVPADVRVDPTAMMALLFAERIDVIDQTPSQLRMLIQAGLLARQNPYPSRVLCGGEAIDSPLWNQLAACTDRRFYNLYGPTECTVDAVACQVTPRSSPILGWPLANVQAHVLDQAMQPVPVGAIGELYIGGAGVGRGYIGSSDQASERFIPDPFQASPSSRLYRTGDRVRRHADGALEYIGRVDKQIKLRGHRIEPAEIEAVLMAHPGVREAVVVCRNTEQGECLVAYHVPQGSGAPSPRELQDRLLETLPKYMIPTAYVAMPSLPLSPNGKLDREALPAPKPQDFSESFTPPENSIQALLAEAFAELLDLKSVGIRDDFFMIGGSSLMLPRLAARIEAKLKVKVPIRLLFRHSTVQSLTSHIEKMLAPSPRAETP